MKAEVDSRVVLYVCMYVSVCLCNAPDVLLKAREELNAAKQAQRDAGS